MPLRTVLPAGLLVALALALAPAARAATTIGDTTTPPTTSGGGATLYIQTGDGARPYGVPAGGGVITSVAARGVGSLTIVAVRPGSGGAYTVVGKQDVTVAGGGPTSSPARFGVDAGDRLAVHVPSGSSLYGVADAAATGLGTPAPTVPAVGDTVTGPAPASGTRLSISAVVEPDADRDGYGDDSQDACPANPLTHVAPCAPDLRVTATAGAASIAQGDVATIVAPITAAVAPAAAPTAILDVPAGLGVVAASTTGGDCTGTTCALGDLAVGQSRKVYLVVRGVTAGTFAVGIRAALAGPVVNPIDDIAAATITVTSPPPPAATPKTPTPQPQPQAGAAVKLCTVPALKGKTAAAARLALSKAGCAAGRATGSKVKAAKVTTQTVPAGVRVVAGTKVGFRLKAPARRQRAR